MSTRNKNKAIFITAASLSYAFICILGSCTGNNDLTGCSDLSIEMQIPMTRSADPGSPQSWDTENETRRKTPVRENECGLFALTEVKKRDKDAFTVQKTDQTASDYYERLRRTAADSCGYEGGAMTANDMLVVGRKHGLLTGMDMFDKDSQPGEYFNNQANRDNARIACFQKEGKDHYAKINSIDAKAGVVRYIDSEGENVIDINKLEGVMYYDK